MPATIAIRSGSPLSAVPGPGRSLAGAAPGLAGQEVAWGRRFPGAEDQVREARGWVRSLLAPGPACERAAAAVAELAGVAIQHMAVGRGGSFTVEVMPSRDVIRVTVASADGPAGPGETGDPFAEQGQGLPLTRSLAWRLGASGDEHAKVAWVDIARGGPGSVKHARDLLARTAALTPSAPKRELMQALREYRAALHALAVATFPPQAG